MTTVQGWLKSTRSSYVNTGSFPRNHIWMCGVLNKSIFAYLKFHICIRKILYLHTKSICRQKESLKKYFIKTFVWLENIIWSQDIDVCSVQGGRASGWRWCGRGGPWCWWSVADASFSPVLVFINIYYLGATPIILAAIGGHLPLVQVSLKTQRF